MPVDVGDSTLYLCDVYGMCKVTDFMTVKNKSGKQDPGAACMDEFHDFLNRYYSRSASRS